MGNSNTTEGDQETVTLKIRFKSSSIGDFIAKHATDVSQGGIFIRTKKPLEVGTPLHFEFLMNDEKPLIDGDATVVWTRDGASSDDAAPGMGLRFDKLPNASQTVLEKILNAKAAADAAVAEEEESDDLDECQTMIGSLNVADMMAEDDDDEEDCDFNDDDLSDATVVVSLDELAKSTKMPVMDSSAAASFTMPVKADADDNEPDIQITSSTIKKPNLEPEPRSGRITSGSQVIEPESPEVAEKTSPAKTSLAAKSPLATKTPMPAKSPLAAEAPKKSHEAEEEIVDMTMALTADEISIDERPKVPAIPTISKKPAGPQGQSSVSSRSLATPPKPSSKSLSAARAAVANPTEPDPVKKGPISATPLPSLAEVAKEDSSFVDKLTAMTKTTTGRKKLGFGAAGITVVLVFLSWLLFS